MAVDVLRRTTANRRAVADLLGDLDEELLETPSLCAGWTCRDVLGHLVMSVELGFGRFLLELARDRGRAAVTSDRLARAYAARPVPELVRSLREHSDAHLSPPGVGPLGPFADSCIHMRDVAIPLGAAVTAPVDDWAVALDFLTTPRAVAAGFLPRGRLDGLRLQAHDRPWSSGSGAAVTGSCEALALSVSGRTVLLDQLTGDGVPALRRRLEGHGGMGERGADAPGPGR